jgi:hypothetical protein
MFTRRLDIHHYFEGSLTVANAALTEQLAAVSTVLSTKDSVIASQSTVIAEGDPSASSVVSSAVDAEDNEIAASISSVLSAG